MIHKKGRFTRLLAGFLAFFMILSGPFASAAEIEDQNEQEAPSGSEYIETETENPPEVTEPDPDLNTSEENPPEVTEPDPEPDPEEENPTEPTNPDHEPDPEEQDPTEPTAPTPGADPEEQNPPEVTEQTPGSDPTEENPPEATEPTPDPDSAESDNPDDSSDDDETEKEADKELSDKEKEEADEELTDEEDKEILEEEIEELSLEEFMEQIRMINNTRAPDTVPDTLYVEPSDTNGITERLYIDVSRVTKTTSGSTFTYTVTCSICLPESAVASQCLFSWVAGTTATVKNAQGTTVATGVSSGVRAVPSIGETEQYNFQKNQNGQTFNITYIVTTDTVPTAMWIKAKNNGLPVQVDVEIISTTDSMEGDISVRTYTCELVLPGTAILENCFLSWNGEMKATVVDDPNGPYKSGKCPIPGIGAANKRTYSFSSNSRRVDFVITAYEALPDTMWVVLSNTGQTEPLDPEQTEPSDPEQTEPSDPEQTEPSDPEQTESSDPEQTVPSNAQRIYIVKNGNSYKLEMPFGIPDGCMFHWNGPLKATTDGLEYASGECPVPAGGSTKTYTFTNAKGDRASFTVTTSVIKPKLRVEPSNSSGIPAVIDIFVSSEKTTSSGSGYNRKTTITYTCGLFLPGNANPDSCVLTWDGDIKAKINNVEYGSGECSIPAVGSITTYTFVSGNTTWKYDITTYQGSPGVPAVFIDIDESMGTIAAMDGDPSHDTECSGRINIGGDWYGLTKMKGRGNYTWEKAQDKKPYNITLDTSINFPGVASGATNKWSFLAEIFDPSLLCNRSGYLLAWQLGVGQDTTSADVWMNGEYQGCYTVTPKTDSFVPSGGFMVEEDNYLEDPVSAGGDPQFTLVGLDEYSPSTGGWSSVYNRITVKDWDSSSWTPESIHSWLQDAWDAIRSDNGFNDKGRYYTEYIDTVSFAKMYLMHEYVKSYDVCAGSILFTCSGDSETGKLTAGPLWDLDNAMGSTYNNGYLGSAGDRRSGSGDFIPNITEYKTSFFKTLIRHSDFKAEVYRQYSNYSSAFDSLPSKIYELRDNIAASANMNHTKVKELTGLYVNNHKYTSDTTIDGQTYYATTSWSVYVANLRTYAAARSAWFQGSASFRNYYIDQSTCNHQYYERITQPTCKSAGSAFRTCTICGYTEEEILQMLPHDYQLNSNDGHYYCANDGCGERRLDATIICDSGVSVTVYETQDLNGEHVDNATIAHPRSSSTGLIDCSGDGQINFVVILEDGCELDEVRVEPDDNFTNLKDQGNNYYRITKVKGDLTITVTVKKSPAPEFKGHQLVLSGQIGVRFGMDLSMLSEEEKAASYMEFTINGRTTRVNTSDATIMDDGRYVYTCFVTSIQMADTIIATFHYNEDTVQQTYSVKHYINYFHEHASEYSVAAVNLVYAIADFGHYAQPFLSATNHWTIGTDYADMDLSFTPAYDFDAVKSNVNDNKLALTKGDSKVETAYMRLTLDSETALSVRLTVADDAELSSTATFHGNTYNAVKQNDGSYIIRVPNIPAAWLGDTVTITGIAGGEFVVTVSALSYVYSVLNNETMSMEAKNAVASLYYYYTNTVTYRAESNH